MQRDLKNSALTALKCSQVLFYGSDLRTISSLKRQQIQIIKKGFSSRTRRQWCTVDTVSVCTNILSEKNIYYLHWKKLFTY